MARQLFTGLKRRFRRDKRDGHRLLVVFAELDQDAIAGAGMEKGHAGSVRARDRSGIDEAVAGVLEALEVSFDVIHAQTDVMDAFSPLLDEPGHR